MDLVKTLPEAELAKVIGDYDGLVVRSATKVINYFSIRSGMILSIIG